MAAGLLALTQEDWTVTVVDAHYQLQLEPRVKRYLGILIRWLSTGPKYSFHPVWGRWMCILNWKFESPCRVHWFDLKPTPLTSRRSHPRALAFWHVLGIHINPGFSLLDPMAEHISGHEVALIQYKNIQKCTKQNCQILWSSFKTLLHLSRSWVKFLNADFMTEGKTADSPLKPQLIFMSRKTARAMLPTKHSIATRVDRRVPAALPGISL